MDRQAFEELRRLPDKVIRSDIRFAPERGFGGNSVFRDVTVENRLDWDVVLNGTFKPLLGAITFNFVVRGVGPICRVDVNGTIHREAGRTHKHELKQKEDPYRNLPFALPRPDLVGRSAREVWTTLCHDASIHHEGNFFDP
jgi:hypothetical protein